MMKKIWAYQSFLLLEKRERKLLDILVLGIICMMTGYRLGIYFVMSFLIMYLFDQEKRTASLRTLLPVIHRFRLFQYYVQGLYLLLGIIWLGILAYGVFSFLLQVSMENTMQAIIQVLGFCLCEYMISLMIARLSLKSTVLRCLIVCLEVALFCFLLWMPITNTLTILSLILGGCSIVGCPCVSYWIERRDLV